MNSVILLSFIGASMLLTIMPGPDIMYVLVQSISNGKKHGIATAAGLVSGILVHTSFVAFGVSAIISSSPSLFFLLKLCGALYLGYLAYKTFKSGQEIHLVEVEKKTLKKLFKQGFIMNVVNPKVSIFFLAFLPGFLYSTTQSTIVQLYVLGGIFMVQAFLIFLGVAVLSGELSAYLKNKKSFNATIKWIQVIAFICIAIFILFF